MTRATLPLAFVCRVYFMDTNLCSRRCTLAAAAAAAAVEESAAGWGCVPPPSPTHAIFKSIPG